MNKIYPNAQLSVRKDEQTTAVNAVLGYNMPSAEDAVRLAKTFFF